MHNIKIDNAEQIIPDSSVTELVSEEHSSEEQNRPRQDYVALLLRMLGVGAVVASLSLFTLNGWSEGNDIRRFISLLSQTGLLALAGWATNKWLNEPKGARVFFSLALGSVVANLTILSAMLYSVWPVDNSLIDYPSAMQWQVVSVSSLLPIALASLAFLIPLAYFGFSILARPFAGSLSKTFFMLSLLLLLPVRLPYLAAILSCIALISAMTFIKRNVIDKSVVITLEMKIAYAMLCLPGIVIAARACLLYPITDLGLSLFALTAYIAIRFWRAIFGSNVFAECLSAVSLVLFALNFSYGLHYLSVDHEFLLACMIIICLGFDHLTNVQSEKRMAFWCNFLTVKVSFVSVVYLLFAQSVFIACASVTVSAALLAVSKYTEKRLGASLIGSYAAWACLCVAGISLVFQFVEIVRLGNWALLGALGVASIVAASVFERRNKQGNI